MDTYESRRGRKKSVESSTWNREFEDPSHVSLLDTAELYGVHKKDCDTNPDVRFGAVCVNCYCKLGLLCRLTLQAASQQSIPVTPQMVERAQETIEKRPKYAAMRYAQPTALAVDAGRHECLWLAPGIGIFPLWDAPLASKLPHKPLQFP